jgi:hypothetical protein
LHRLPDPDDLPEPRRKIEALSQRKSVAELVRDGKFTF